MTLDEAKREFHHWWYAQYRTIDEAAEKAAEVFCRVTAAEDERLKQARRELEADSPAEPQYPCQKCGKLRTKAQGGTTFTVCDECWDKRQAEQQPKSRLDASDPPGWYECVMTVLGHRIVLWWDGKQLWHSPSTPASRPVEGQTHYRPLVHAPDLSRQLAEAQAEVLDLEEKLAEQEKEIGRLNQIVESVSSQEHAERKAKEKTEAAFKEAKECAENLRLRLKKITEAALKTGEELSEANEQLSSVKRKLAEAEAKLKIPHPARDIANECNELLKAKDDELARLRQRPEVVQGPAELPNGRWAVYHRLAGRFEGIGAYQLSEYAIAIRLPEPTADQAKGE